MVLLSCARTYLKSIRSDKVKKLASLGNKVSVDKKSVSSEFIDSLKLRVTGGSGGNGCPVSKAIGGTGGNVIVEASREFDDLSHVKSLYSDSKAEATNGLDGRRTRLIGPNGTDCIIKVPCGVSVFNEYLSIISDLIKDGDKTIVAHGGPGGNVRNNYFGLKGQSQLITLDLRYNADISLIGYPDSGKSLLQSKLISSDRKLLPEVSSKKGIFAKRPWLQDIKFEDSRVISCVDLPSLTEGAHRAVKHNGHHWLKHIHHNQLIVFVLDINGFNRGIHRKPIETLLLLNKQVEIFDDRYLFKPALIVVNKMDSPKADVAYEDFLLSLRKIYKSSDKHDLEESIFPEKLIYYQDIIPISCYRDRNIDYLKQRIRELIDFNYLKSRNPACPRSFVSLLESINQTRTIVKTQLE